MGSGGAATSHSSTKTYSRATAVLRVAGAVAAGAPERGERCEECSLHGGRRLRRPAQLGELAEDHRELQSRRISLVVDLAVPCGAEQRLQQPFRLQPRAQREAPPERSGLP